MKILLTLIAISLIAALPVISQEKTAADPLPQHATLQACVRYALDHQPAIRLSLIDEEITERAIQSKIADWYPQLNLGFSVIHYSQVPVSVVGGTPIKVSLANSSSGQLSLTQNLFNRDVLLAASSAGDVRKRITQQTARTRIDAVVNVSKAYYAVLVTQKQVELIDEDILRLGTSLKDAYDRYKGGIVDNIDYKRASIALNLANAEKKQIAEQLKVRIASLKEEMGSPSDADLVLQSDSTEMEREALIDTTFTLDYDRRIELQLLETDKHLQEANLQYYKWGFLPSVSAIGNYSMNFQNDGFSQLYRNDYPSSFVGLQLSFPIFTGFKRLQQISQAEWELKRYDEDAASLKSAINTEYTRAIANYRSSVNTYHALKENLALAKDVYQTIQLQYKAGTKTYLEVIIAETDLRSAQANYADALYQLLSNKFDVQKALGIVQY